MDQSREIESLRKRLSVANSRAVEAELRLYRREEECGAAKAAYQALQDVLERICHPDHIDALISAKPFLKSRETNVKTSQK